MTTDNREAAEIDLLIRKLRPSVPSRVATIGSRPPSQVRGIYIPRRAGVVRSCVALGVLLGVAVPYWPYPRTCGPWLFLYLIAVGLIVVAGIWGARLTWDSRLGFTHIVALGVVCWGAVLAAQVILPRVGYAKTPAFWLCQ